MNMRSPLLSEAGKAENLFKKHEQFTCGEIGARAEIIAKEWQFPGFNLAEDARVIVNEKNEWLGYTALWNTTKPHVSNFIIQRIDPDYMGTEVDESLSLWAEEKARQNIIKAPSDAEVVLGHTINSTQKETIKRLKNSGFSEKRYFWRMGIDLRKTLQPPLFPEGITLTTHAERKNLMDLVLCDRASFADHWGYVESPLDEEFSEWEDWIKMEPFYDPDYWFLACSGDEIIGMSLCFNGMTIDKQIGYLDSVCVKKEYRKKGIASALLRHSFMEMKKSGREKAYLHVDADSLTGATKLYESVGMNKNQSSTKMEKIIRRGKSYRTEQI